MIHRVRIRLIHLFALMTLACVLVGAVARRVNDIADVKSVIEMSGGVTQVEDTFLSRLGDHIGLDGLYTIKEVYFHQYGYVAPTDTDGDVNYWYLRTSEIDNDGLVKLLPVLRRLNDPFKLTLIGVKVSDSGLREMRSIRALYGLDVSGTMISNKGLSALKGMHCLRSLYVADTSITDEAIPDLVALGLTELDVSFTRMTPDGLNRLRALSPDCEVVARGIKGVSGS